MKIETKNAPLERQTILGRKILHKSVDERMQTALMQQNQLPEIVARLLAIRNISPNEAENYLHPTIKNNLPNPSHLLDMDKGAERLAAAIISGEKVAIFGDYDVDGATSSAVIARFLKSLGAQFITYIPDRQKEGYGPNIDAFISLKNQGASLIITVDCGTLAFEPLAEAFKIGLDVIVVDHHISETKKPDCFALINPNRADESSPHRYLAAVGVAYLLCVATNRLLREDGFYTQRQMPDLISLLDIVALGTVCDMVSLTGVNRAFVAQGLKVMAAQKNTGIKALMKAANIDKAPDVFHLGFLLGPRINAGGRVGESSMGVRLLVTDDEIEAEGLSLRLNQFNKERQAIEELMMEEAMLQAQAEANNHKMIILHSKHWHSGVVGIIAGRIKERFNKPTAVITFSNGEGKASARSVSGFDLGAAVIQACSEGVLLKGGGHAMAAGFSINENKIEEAKKWFEAAVAKSGVATVKTLEIDGIISASGLNNELIKSINSLGPFGIGNSEPLIAFEHMQLTYVKALNGGHITLGFSEEKTGAKLRAIAFRIQETELGEALLNGQGKTFSIIGNLSINNYQNREDPQLKLVDAISEE